MKNHFDTKKTIICLTKIGNEPTIKNALKTAQVTEFNVDKHLINVNSQVAPGYIWQTLKINQK